jgi:Protein of unknown function (DUF1579)
MQTEPQREHQWLQQLVGEWTYEAEATTDPGQPPSKFEGSERVRSLGGLWILAEGQGEMPGCGAARGEWHWFMRANYRRTKSP